MFENSFTNKLYKSYDIKNYIIDKDFIFDKDKILYEDDNTIIYNLDNEIGFKIEKSLLNKTRESYNIEKMVSSLVLKQKNIKLTSFPIGIVSLNKRCIGQMIMLFKDYKPLNDIINNDNKDILYNKVLNIINELLDNDIVYLDIHKNNFLVNEDLDVELIDFESSCVIINNITNKDKITCLEKVKDMFNNILIKK